MFNCIILFGQSVMLCIFGQYVVVVSVNSNWCATLLSQTFTFQHPKIKSFYWKLLYTSFPTLLAGTFN